MSELQEAFLFDYRAFLEAAAPLIQAMDKGDLQPLRAHAIQILRRVGSPRNWILQDKGTELPTIEGLQHDTTRADGKAPWSEFYQGHVLLLVLSSFLRPAVSLEYDWPELQIALAQLNWSGGDINLLREGRPTSDLVKPGEASNPKWSAGGITAPYWRSINPYQATGSGWLPTETIVELHRRLVSHQDRIANLRDWFRLPAYVDPTGATEFPPRHAPEYWYQRIPRAYMRAIAMLRQAINVGEGLFFVLTIS